jgi:hypothetical protein
MRDCDRDDTKKKETERNNYAEKWMGIVHDVPSGHDEVVLLEARRPVFGGGGHDREVR